MLSRTKQARRWPTSVFSTLSFSILAALNGHAIAADNVDPDEETISVIGTRVAVRSESETAVPVDIIRGETLREAGFTDVGKALEAIAPSYNFAEMSITDGSDHVKPAMLRGMGPDQTLVLINGKRRHASALIHTFSIGKGAAGTDLNAIPMSAVSRIEILRDGASAQYGSDAIAGVINIVLNGATGTSVSGQYYTTSEGDGETVQAAVNSGIEIGNGFLNLTAEYKKQDEMNRARPDPFTNNSYAGEWLQGEPNLNQSAVFYNFSMPFAGGAGEIYSFGGVSTREGHAGGYFRCPQLYTDNNGNVIDADNDPNFEHPTNYSYCGVIPDAVSAVYPRGTLPMIDSTVDDSSFALGAKFELMGWNADVSFVKGENKFNFGISDSLNYSYGLGPTGNAADVPTSADSGSLVFGQQNLTFDLSKEFGSFTVAAGFALRTENFEIEAGECYSYANYADANNGCDTIGVGTWALDGVRSGVQVFPGWRPEQAVDIERNSSAVFVEMVTEITADWRIEAAVRQEDYDDFGTDLSTKLASYLRISDSINFRAAYSDGFRAPSLQQIGYSQFISSFDQGPVTKGIFRIGDGIDGNQPFDVADAFDIPQLDAEDSKSFTAGFVFEPMDKMNITLDFYQIDIKDRITISGEFSRNDFQFVADTLDANGLQDVTAVSFFTNAIDTKTEGMDLILHYSSDIATGRLDYTLASSYNKTEVTHIDEAPGILAGQGLQDTYFDRHELARTEKYSPSNRHNISVDHVTDSTRFGISMNYYGSITTVYDATDPTYDYTDQGRWIMNLSFGYKFDAGVNLNFYINNVTDEYPESDHTAWNGVTLPYSEETLQWGLAGRTYTLSANMKF